MFDSVFIDFIPQLVLEKHGICLICRAIISEKHASVDWF